MQKEIAMNFAFQKDSDLKIKFFYKDSVNIPGYLSQNGYFLGEESEIFVQASSSETIFYAGLGEEGKTTSFNLLKTGIFIARQLKKVKNLTALLELEHFSSEQVFFIAQGLFIELNYNFSLKKEIKPVTISNVIFPENHKDIVERASLLAGIRNKVRLMVDLPANILTTTVLVEKIKENLSEIPCEIEVWNKEKLAQENMAGLLAVGSGSVNPPYMVRVHYKPENVKKKLVLIGKGICFDSGGLSLKPSDSMLDMKTDMAGAATVAGMVEAIHAFKLPIELTAFMPIAENMPSQNCYKIGDILRYKNGKSVEIVNTDAEGRLILADALCLSEKVESDLIIDIATLTGACMVALGTDIYGVLSNQEKLSFDYSKFVNEHSSENAWPLPLFKKYKSLLKSPLADMKNSGKRFGGAISAALFLQEFVPEKKTWIHLDIAGPSYDDGIGLFDALGTGVPLESLFLYLETEFLKEA